MIFLKEIFLLVFCILGSIQGQIRETEVDAQLTSSILKYLNERNHSYFYKSGIILQKTVRNDELEVIFDIETVCDLPCLGGILQCQSIYHKITGEPLWHITGAICAPKEPLYSEQRKNFPALNEQLPSEQDKVPQVHMIQEPNIVQAFIEEPKTVQNPAEPQHKPIETIENNSEKSIPCLGCAVDINPNANGVTNLINAALRHIESERNQKHTALRVLRIQEQVVAGIRYSLLVEVAPTVCPKNLDSPSCPIDQSKGSFVCEIEFWEKAWERFSQVYKNNCTNIQEFAYNNPINTTPKPIDREVDFGDLESQILSDDQIQQAENAKPDWANGINPVYSTIGYNGPEVILQKRKVRDIQEHVISKRLSNHIDSGSSSSSSSSESNESNDKKKHNHNSEVDDSDSSKHSHNHKHQHKKSDSDSDSHENNHKHKHSHQDSSDSDERDDSSKSSKSCESSESSESDDHKKKHKHDHKRRKRQSGSDDWIKSIKSSESSESSESSQSDDHKKKNRGKRSIEYQNDQRIVKYLSRIASRTLGYGTYEVVGSSKIVLDGTHYKLLLLLEKNRTVIECSVFMTVNEESIYESTIDKYRCNTDEVWQHKERPVKRDELVGGIAPMSTEDPQIKFFLKDGLTSLDKSSPHTNKYKVLRVIEATRQVVSGNLYRIKVHVTVSDCEKGNAKESEMCGVLEDAPVQECNFKIWDQPWRPQGRQTKVSCENDEKNHLRLKRSSGILAGGINPIPKDDPQVKLYLKDGLNKLDQSSQHAHKYKVLEILKTSSQVISGSLHRIQARITVSDCEKGKDVDPDTCGVLKDAPVKVCNFKVWDQPWLPQGRQTNITCDDVELSFRQRRSVNLPSHEDVVGVIFKQFQLKHSKIYLNKAEYKHRLAVFKNNLNMIDLLNKYEQGTARYGITRYADLTQTEFSALHGLRTDLHNENEVPFPQAKIPEIDLPTSLDWRDKNAVTEVKDQGFCGSCWAFSTTGNIEGQYAIKYKSLKSFSEQELVDCDKLDDGCNGGLMDNAYRAIENLGGLELENQYPYDGKNDKCNFNKSEVVVHVSSALNISSNETDMAKWLTQNGPISIAINANAMQFYMGGVSHPLRIFCSPNNLDHGILVVGYGVHTSSILKKVLPYWIVKNSWGKSWGEQGYYRVYRGDGTCGLNQTPSSAIVS